jgi:hypothetical protein
LLDHVTADAYFCGNSRHVLKIAEKGRGARILRTVIISAMRPYMGWVLSPGCCPFLNIHIYESIQKYLIRV